MIASGSRAAMCRGSQIRTIGPGSRRRVAEAAKRVGSLAARYLGASSRSNAFLPSVSRAAVPERTNGRRDSIVEVVVVASCHVAPREVW